MHVGAETHVGRIRHLNEDDYHVASTLLAVADGMGGHAAGEVASRLVISTLANWPGWDEPARELRACLLHANDLIIKGAKADSTQAGMGTTVTVAHVGNGKLYYAHVGDSRLYLLRHNILRKLTHDHSVVAELLRSGQLTENEARTHPQRNLLTRALGVSGHIDIDLGEVDLTLYDRLLLCTDGLNVVLVDQEIQHILSTPDPSEAAKQLVAAANARGGPDNITVFVDDIVKEDLI
jgi:serine/threonine protein phosphatase PrpC